MGSNGNLDATTSRPSSRRSCSLSPASSSRVSEDFMARMAAHNPLVLIHAPLYYRLAAWRAGRSVARGSIRSPPPGRGPAPLRNRFPGRRSRPSIGLARLGGLSRRAGCWSGPLAGRRHAGLWRRAARSPARHAGNRRSRRSASSLSVALTESRRCPGQTGGGLRVFCALASVSSNIS